MFCSTPVLGVDACRAISWGVDVGFLSLMFIGAGLCFYKGIKISKREKAMETQPLIEEQRDTRPPSKAGRYFAAGAAYAVCCGLCCFLPIGVALNSAYHCYGSSSSAIPII